MKSFKSFQPGDRPGKSPLRIAIRSLIVLIVLIGSTTLRASSVSPQHETLFTLSFVDASLKDVLAEIEKDSEYTFICKDGVNIYEKVTFTVEKERIEAILPQLLKGQNLLFDMDDTQITIYKKEAQPFRQIVQTVKGIVTDGYGEPVVCASVQVKGSANGTATGTKGEFELPIEGESITLVVSYAGDKSTEVVAYPGQNLKIVLPETASVNR